MTKIMNKVDIRILKDTCYSILKEFDRLCKNSNLKYSLAYGTLLGAVIHKGFIPWDDDIDVIMPISDYDRLLKIGTSSDKFKILSHENESSYYYTFAKMVDTTTVLREKTKPNQKLGVYIDIFPVEYCDNKVACDAKEKNKKLIKRIKFFSSTSNNRAKKQIKNFVGGIAGFIDEKYIEHIYDNYELFLRSINSEKKECSCLFSTGAYLDKNVFTWDLFSGNLIELEFECKKFPVIPRYDTFLTQLYGDYMKLPPEEKQISQHEFTIDFL